jgi:hypothetical protein
LQNYSKEKAKHAMVGVDEICKSAIIAVRASILAARKLVAVPGNSPAYVAGIIIGCRRFHGLDQE